MSLRTLRRSVSNGQRSVGTLGGHCPRCDAHPLALVVDWVEYGQIAGCAGCGWTSAKPVLWLVAFLNVVGEVDEDGFREPDWTPAGGAVVRAIDAEQAQRRTASLRAHTWHPFPIGEVLDRVEIRPEEIGVLLTDEQLTEIIDRNVPPSAWAITA